MSSDYNDVIARLPWSMPTKPGLDGRIGVMLSCVGDLIPGDVVRIAATHRSVWFQSLDLPPGAAWSQRNRWRDRFEPLLVLGDRDGELALPTRRLAVPAHLQGELDRLRAVDGYVCPDPELYALYDELHRLGAATLRLGRGYRHMDDWPWGELLPTHDLPR